MWSSRRWIREICVVEAGERVGGADDDLVQVICRASGVVAGVFEFDRGAG
jgi:hypothetical protein